MKNEDYQLEELENAAVNKSNNAKRIAAAAGLLATGGAAGYAATNIPVGSNDEPVELTEEDIESVAETGANQVHEPEVQPQPVQTTSQEAAPVESELAPSQEEQVDVKFETTTHFYDADNNLVGMTEEGTINGKDFALVDVNGDKNADYLAYDENGNGVYENHEVIELQGRDQITMEHAATHHEDVFIASNEPEPEPYVYYDINEEKDYADNSIHNDFEDEKTGETYNHDYAENNDDYNNGNPESYSAENQEYAYEEEEKEESDYEYNDIAENESTDDTFDDLGSDSLDIV